MGRAELPAWPRWILAGAFVALGLFAGWGSWQLDRAPRSFEGPAAALDREGLWWIYGPSPGQAAARPGVSLGAPAEAPGGAAPPAGVELPLLGWFSVEGPGARLPVEGPGQLWAVAPPSLGAALSAVGVAALLAAFGGVVGARRWMGARRHRAGRPLTP